ncbi:MAG: glycoside hydrolase family 25 protein [Oscillospiraceae bacterium]|nr:glycoside hydrolase family 25 protein [Oscillospiraceae bacterium]
MAKKRRKKKKQPSRALVLWLTVLAAILFTALLGLILYSCVARQDADVPAVDATEMTEELAPLNERDPEDFRFEDGFLRYPGAETGIDVSTHQGLIDWEQVRDAGITFAIIRAGYRGSTEGRLYEDELFWDNLNGAKAAGLKVGVYFFSQAISVEEAAEEAEYVLNLLNGEPLELPVYYDWEQIAGTSRINYPGTLPLTECSVAFCEAVREQGYTPGVYFNREYGYAYLDFVRLRNYALWLAEYGDNPTFRYRYDCLQYTDAGRIPGIETTVDMDLIFQ